MTPLLLVALALAGDAADATAPAASPADAAPPTAPAPEVPAAPQVQWYAMRQTFTSEMRDPNPFSRTGWRSTHTNTYAVVQAKRTGTALTYDERTCRIETQKVFGAETIYTDAFLAAVPVRHRTAKLTTEAPGARFTAGPYVQSFGVNLKDPYNDQLPTDPSDPRLVDTDKDGAPGVTVVISHPLVGRGSVWVAQRSVARLDGTLAADGSIHGVIYTAPDMYKIGADRWWLKVDSPQRQHPDPAKSPFVLVPVPPDTTCATVIADEARLFPPLPPLDG